jgi:putative transposase
MIKQMLESSLKWEQLEELAVDEYERGEQRRGYRNGSYLRDLRTRIGEINDIEVPRCRKKIDYKTIDKYIRIDKDVNLGIGQMYLHGVSTTKVGQILESILGYEVSPGYVCQVTKELDKEVKKFYKRELDDKYIYLILDGIYLKHRKLGGGTHKRAVLVAHGITNNGRKEMIHFRVGGVESEASWKAFLEELKNKGLKGKNLELIVIDGNKGLKKALGWIYPFIPIQRCWVHKMRNALNYCKKSQEKDFKKDAQKIYLCKSKREACYAFKELKNKWSKDAYKAVKCIENDLENLLAFYHCPESHYIRIRSTNVIERCFREVRRRVSVMGTFPNIASCERMTYSLFTYFNKKWTKRSFYIKNFNIEKAA